MIAFVSIRDGNAEVYVMDADGKNQRNLTNNPADDWGPAWSPDGKMIAFTSKRDGNLEVYVMDADGKNQHNLTNNPADDWCPSWFDPAFARSVSPAGKHGAK
jgi:TolB protein